MSVSRSRLALLCSLVVGLGCLMVVLPAGSRASGTVGDPAIGSLLSDGWAGASAGGPTIVSEDPSLRTADTRTYRLSNGSMLTRAWTAAVNYEDAAGDWQPIDTTLRADGDGLVTTAADTTVSLPDSAADPAKVDDGDGHWLSFDLQGADASVDPAVDGSSATYADVRDGVDASYVAQPEGLKETLTLGDAGAPSTYRYVLDSSAGLTAVLRADGSVELRDGSGNVQFTLPTPTVQEAGQELPSSSHVAYELSADGQQLSVVVDPAWLASASFPVKVDPTIYTHTQHSCGLVSNASANTANCDGTKLAVGSVAGSPATVSRAALRWTDLSTVVPQTASIQQAVIGLSLTSQSGLATAGARYDVTELTGHQLGTGATWNRYDNLTHAPGSTPDTWTTPGGDLAAAETSDRTILPSYVGGVVTWDVSSSVQKWIRDPSTNFGIEVAAHAGTPNALLQFAGTNYTRVTGSVLAPPNLSVIWQEHPGRESDQAYELQTIDPLTQNLGIDDATGNLSVSDTDVALPGLNGPDLTISRTYNSADLGDGHEFGSAWSEDIDGAGTRMDHIWQSHAFTFYGAGGGIYRYDRNPAADTATTLAYTSPANAAYDLTASKSDLSTTLTPHAPGVLSFSYGPPDANDQSHLTKVKSTLANALTIAYRSNGTSISQITETHGLVVAFSYDANGALSKIATPAIDAAHPAGNVLYHLTSHSSPDYQRLDSVTTPAGKTTSFTYDPTVYDKLTKITESTAGHTDILEYGTNGDGTQLTKITQALGGSTPSIITQFNYKPASTAGHACNNPASSSSLADKIPAGRTLETSNSGQVTTYCYNRSAQLLEAWRDWDTVAPTPTPSGDFYNLNGTYINGTAAYALGMTGTDPVPGSGTQTLSLTQVGNPTIVAQAINTCTGPSGSLPTLCPDPFGATTTIPTAGLGEGVHSYQLTATDEAGNTAVSAPWTFWVDRTGPAFSSDFVVTAGLDTANEAVVRWDAAEDPSLTDGSMPSGMNGYQFRYLHAGGAWSAWVGTSTESATVPGSHNGESIALEIVPIDQVGNQGATKMISVIVSGTADPCDATANGIPSGCSTDPATETEEDAGLEDPVTLTPDNSTPSGILPMTSVPATRYTVGVGGGGWATIRRNHGSFVLGNVRNGWSMDVQDGSLANGSVQGRVLGDYGDCGWVFASGFTSSGTRTTGCQLSPTNPPVPSRFADKLNCTACNAGSPTQVLHASFPFCPNVSPTPLDHQPKNCLSPIVDRFTSSDEHHGATYTVYWRYITNGGRYVLVDDKAHGYRRSDATWVFIDRRALRKNLCVRDTPAGPYHCGTA